jgi:lantibiotic modifying enzyme
MRQTAQKQLDRVNEALMSGVSRNDSFLSGKLGLSFYYYHLFKVTGNIDYSNKAEELLDAVMENLSSGYPKLVGASFGSGGAGLGYIMNFFNKEQLISFEIDKDFEALDEYLFRMAFLQIEEDFIDYLHGALGVVHYFSQREKTVVIDDYLDKLVVKICDRAIKKDGGYWFRNHVLKIEDKENINFGLSHGLSGILLILLNVYERSSHKEVIERVITEGIRFIRKYKMDIDFSNDEYSFFPFIVRQDAVEITAPNRLGWCYGDLNQVLLFYRAGKLFNDNELIDLADVIGAQTLMRKDLRSTLVVDSGFCHGTSGLAQFYRTIYNERGLSVYKEAYEFWMEQTILMLDKDFREKVYAGKELELLDGLVGVGFALLSYLSEDQLDWSRSLLL